jgi:membrane fusion protein
MASRLFRDEVFEARRSQSLGAGRLTLGGSGWVVVRVAVALAAALLTFAFVAEVTRKSHVQGVLLPAGGPVVLNAPTSGRISALRVAEGQVVDAGDPLLTLALDRDTATGPVGERVASQLAVRREALQSEQRLRATQIRLQQQALQARIQALHAEERRIDDEIAMADGRRALVRKQADRLAQLVADGFVSATQAQAQQQELLESDAAVQRLHRSRIALARDRTSLAADGEQLEAQLLTEQAQIDRQIAALDQERVENEARQAQVVASPTAGTVTLVAASTGQTVQPGQLVVSITPAASPLQAHLFAPSRTIGFAEVGQPVRLRYAAFPY